MLHSIAAPTQERGSMRRPLAAAAGATLFAGLVVALPASPASAETEIVVYKDQITQPDTRSTGHVNWPVGGGIRLSTEGSTSTDKATFAFDTHPELVGPDDRFYLSNEAIGHDVNVKSGGDQAIPGIQIYMDDGIVFVKEDVYQVDGFGNPGTSDIWLTNESPRYLRAYAPSCESDHPELETMTSDQAIAAGLCTGGSGSAWHGSETEWASVLYNLAPNEDTLIIRGLGESLGSGVKGNVLVSSINYGDAYYTFSRQNAPAPEPTTVDPTSRVLASIDTSTCRTANFAITLPSPAANEVYGPYQSVGFRFMSAGQQVLRDTLDPGETLTRTVTFTPHNTNIPRVKIFVTAPGQAPTAYPSALKVDLGVNRRC
jgi:hypothetical protein